MEKINKDWEMVRLGNYIEILSGFAFDSKKFNDSNGTPLIRIRDIKRSYSNTYYNGIFDKKYIIRRSDILIGMDGEFNIAEWTGSDSLLNQRVCKISVKKTENLNKRYLLHFLPAALKEIESKASFVTVKHLSVSDISEIQIPLPPLETQKKIAEILDTADALRKKDEALLKKYEELAQAIFIDMFGDPVKNEKGWEVRKLGEVCDKITDGTHQSPKFTPNGIPFLFVSNIVKNKIEYKTKSYISHEEFEILNKRTPIEIGNILITTVGSYGNPAIIESIEPFAFQRHIAFLKPNHKAINYIYLFGFLKSPVAQMQIERSVKGVAQKTLNLSELKNIDIWDVPIELQNTYENCLNLLNNSISPISINKSENLFNSLLQKAFRGELVA